MNKMIYVSVLNLITKIQLTDKNPVSFAVLYPTDVRMPLQALNAGPKFPKEVRDYLIKSCGADPLGFYSDNAQCRIPEEKLDVFIKWIHSQYCSRFKKPIIDLDPSPYTSARLTRPYWGNIPPPLDKLEFDNTIMLDFQGLVRQPPSLEEDLGMELNNVNLFIVWHMWVSDTRVFEKLIACPAIIFLNDGTVKTTQGGQCDGWHGKFNFDRSIGVEDYKPHPCTK